MFPLVMHKIETLCLRLVVGETGEQPDYYFDIRRPSLYPHFTKPQRKNRQYDVLKNIIL
jgi:hypothetical protein